MSNFGKVQGIVFEDAANLETSKVPADEVPATEVLRKTRVHIHKQPRSIRALNIKLGKGLKNPKVLTTILENDLLYLEIEYDDEPDIYI